MLYIFFFIIGFVLYWYNPYVRLIVNKFYFVMYYLPIDIFYYFAQKKWRLLQTGKIWVYCAPDFGGGKTLSAVQYIEELYNAFDGLVVWDFSRKKFVVQKVKIISNVVFNNVPYDDFVSLAQISEASNEAWKQVDIENDTLTCTLFFMDEASSELNSRSFRDNLNPLVLKDIVTCRHNHISLFMTSQSFKLIDALMREVTSKVIYSFKKWRLCVHYYYDPKELEISGSYRLIKPIGTGGFFVRNKNYEAYDTFATVKKMIKKFEENDLLTSEEILVNIGRDSSNTDAILRPSRRFIKARKR